MRNITIALIFYIGVKRCANTIESNSRMIIIVDISRGWKIRNRACIFFVQMQVSSIESLVIHDFLRKQVFYRQWLFRTLGTK